MRKDPLGTKLVERGWDLQPMIRDGSFAEKHYRVAELASLWGLGRNTVRRIVIDEPDVVKIRMGKKQAYTTYSIPESVARRIHIRLTSAA